VVLLVLELFKVFTKSKEAERAKRCKPELELKVTFDDETRELLRELAELRLESLEAKGVGILAV
jgi:hypothetical protein